MPRRERRVTFRVIGILDAANASGWHRDQREHDLTESELVSGERVSAPGAPSGDKRGAWGNACGRAPAARGASASSRADLSGGLFGA